MPDNSCYHYRTNFFVYVAGELNTSPEYLNHLLREGNNVNACNEDGERAIHRATKINRIKLIEVLIKYKANPDALNNDNQTALDIAKQNNNLPIINLLTEYSKFYSLSSLDYNYLYAAKTGNFSEVKSSLKNGASLKATTRDFSTGLHLAIENGHFKIAEHLVKRKINLYARNNEGNAAIHLAAKSGNLTFTKNLIDQYSINILNNDLKTATDLAGQNNHSDVENMLIKYQRFYTLSPWDTNYLYAAKIGNFTEVKNSLEHGANPNARTPELETALHLAAIIGDVETVYHLVDYYPVDVNALETNQASALHYAMMNDNNNTRKIITKLLSVEADVNLNSKDGYSFLYKISHRGYDEAVNIAVGRVANINEASNDQKATALHAAAMNNHLKVVYLLVAKGIDVTLTNLQNKTALSIAWEASHYEINKYLKSKTTQLISASANGKIGLVEAILAKGISIESTEYYGHNALDVAVEHGHLNMVIYLFEHGAKIKTDMLGYTPLHAAAKNQDYPMMDVLIGHGAELKAANFLGVTPADLAPEYRYHQMPIKQSTISGDVVNCYSSCDNEV